MTGTLVRKWFMAFAALFLIAPLAFAADSQPYVVLVGVGEYRDPAIKPRPRAEDDVKALYDLLSDKNSLKTTPDHIKLLLGKKDEKRPSEVATRENILNAIRWAISSAKEDDLVLLCWVGQGGPVGDRTGYFAADSTLKDRVKNAVGAAEIEQELDKAKSTRICVLLDVHFRGYEAKEGEVPEAGLSRVFQEFDGIKEDSEGPPKPIMLLAANNGLKPTVETPAHGLFTGVVLDALAGKADDEGGEADGVVTIDELFDYVRKELPKRAQQTAQRDQLPIGSGRSTHFPLTTNPAAYAKAKERLDRFEALAKSGKVNEEVAKEGRELLEKMPRLEAQRRLRKNYQQLADGSLTVEDFVRQREAYLSALKLPRSEADNFADKVLKVARIAQEGYVKPVKINDLVGEAVKGLYKHPKIDEKIPAAIQERLAKVKELDEDALRTLLADARQELGSRDDLKGQKAADLAMEMMLHSLDPYSTYIDPETLEEFKRQTEQVFIGVGIQIQRDLGRDMVRVSTPLRGSPAYKAGIKTGDIITKVTNYVDKKGDKLNEPETTSTKGMNINDVVKKILGKRGTKVKLTVERETAEGTKEIEFEITRGSVEVETVFGVRRLEDDSWDYYLDKANKIGYIRLGQFAVNTERDLVRALKQLEKDGLNALILDLRFNPGGYLDSAVKISDLFIDDGLVVTIRPREGRHTEFKGRHADSRLSFPLVVLVNGGSASASEIVSACIQDHERGIIMGERSFGKGSVQNIMQINLGEGRSELKLTTASFWRPNGRNLNKFPTSKESDDWGVVPSPEFTVKLTPSERGELFEHLRKNEVIPRRDAPKKDKESSFVDRQLDKALEYLRGQVTVKASAK